MRGHFAQVLQHRQRQAFARPLVGPPRALCVDFSRLYSFAPFKPSSELKAPPPPPPHTEAPSDGPKVALPVEVLLLELLGRGPGRGEGLFHVGDPDGVLPAEAVHLKELQVGGQKMTTSSERRGDSRLEHVRVLHRAARAVGLLGGSNQRNGQPAAGGPSQRSSGGACSPHPGWRRRPGATGRPRGPRGGAACGARASSPPEVGTAVRR